MYCTRSVSCVGFEITFWPDGEVFSVQYENRETCFKDENQPGPAMIQNWTSILMVTLCVTRAQNVGRHRCQQASAYSCTLLAVCSGRVRVAALSPLSSFLAPRGARRCATSLRGHGRCPSTRSAPHRMLLSLCIVDVLCTALLRSAVTCGQADSMLRSTGESQFRWTSADGQAEAKKAGGDRAERCHRSSRQLHRARARSKSSGRSYGCSAAIIRRPLQQLRKPVDEKRERRRSALLFAAPRPARGALFRACEASAAAAPGRMTAWQAPTRVDAGGVGVFRRCRWIGEGCGLRTRFDSCLQDSTREKAETRGVN